MTSSSVLSAYDGGNNAITITLASLASGNARASTAIDNTTNKFTDAAVYLLVKTGSTVTGAKGLNLRFYGTSDGGSHYTEGATGTDAAITLVNPTNFQPPYFINTPGTTTAYSVGPYSVAAIFGFLPQKWGVVIENLTGGTLDSTSGNFSVFYQGLYDTVG